MAEDNGSWVRDRRLIRLARVLAASVVAILSLRLAWVGDDALITLRMALNATHGFGLGFNPSEAVQAYTHPLWWLLWVLLGAITGQWVFGILLVSVALTSLAVLVLVWRINDIALLVVATCLLVFSNAFMEYSTSGLETPLAYALVAVLIALTSRSSDVGARSPWWYALIGLALAGTFLTRMDLALLLTPPLLLFAWRLRTQVGTLAIAAASALVPLALWFAWSIATYHTMLPNTFAAKRNVNIPLTELVFQGVRYMWVALEHDPISWVAIILGVATSLAIGRGFTRAWGIGVLAYLAYVLWIGGDYMGSRFLAIPVFVSVFTLVLAVSTQQSPLRTGTVLTGRLAAAVGIVLASAGIASVAGAMPVAMSNPQGPRWAWEENAGIADERGLSVERGRTLRTALIEGQQSIPSFTDFNDPQSINLTLLSVHSLAKTWPTANDGSKTPAGVAAVCGWLPVYGIATGPRTHLIDTCGLTDRFVASIPFTPPYPLGWRAGHLERQLPDGYVDAVASGDPSRLADPVLARQLADLWSQIRASTS